MNKTKLMLAMLAACVALAGCEKKDFDAVTGSTDFTSVALSSDPTSYDLHVVFVPRVITVDTAGVADTVAAHYEPVDSTEFTVTAKLEPQDVAVGNPTDNMVISPDDADVARVNDDGGFLLGTGPGTTHLTFVYTDVDHDFTTTTLTVPVTVTAVAPAP
jgi:ABC-type Fe3+-hydroxamate transport system substrate-binding protein